MKAQFFTVAVFFAVTAAQTARAADANQCDLIVAAIADVEKDMSADFAEGISDNSAPRATLREVKSLRSLALAQLNLSLAIHHGCKNLPTKPISSGAYVIDAMKCSTAMLEARLAKADKVPSECDRSQWKRME